MKGVRENQRARRDRRVLAQNGMWITLPRGVDPFNWMLKHYLSEPLRAALEAESALRRVFRQQAPEVV